MGKLMKRNNILSRILISFAAASVIMSSASPAMAKTKAKTKTVKLKNITVTAGKSKTVKASGKKKITWSSSDKKIATVKSAGKIKAKVTGKKAGTAKITGKIRGKKWTFKVTVKKKTAKVSTAKTSLALENKIKEDLTAAGIESGMSDIQKFARLCRWWNNNVLYDKKEANDNSANDYLATVSVLKKYGINDGNFYIRWGATRIAEFRKGVCDDMAKAMCYYCGVMGIKAIYVVSSGASHALNHVFLDDGWYVFDSTNITCGTYKTDGTVDKRNQSISVDDYISRNKIETWEEQSARLTSRYQSRGYDSTLIASRLERAKEEYQDKINSIRELNLYHLAAAGNQYLEYDALNAPFDVYDFYANRNLTDEKAFDVSNWKTYKTKASINKTLTGEKYVNAVLSDYL